MSVDTNRLAYSGEVPPASVQAKRARRMGWWFYTEYWLRQARAYGWPVLLESVVTPMLYLVAMGMGLGALVNRGVGQVDGVRYIDFVAPALLVSTAMMSAMGESTYTVMGGFKWQRTYLGAAQTPLSPGQIATGHLAGAGLRFFAQSLVFWLVMVIFGAAHGAASVLMVPIATLGALAFACPVTAYSATIEDEGLQFNMIQRFVVMPMSLFAGTFFPLTAMPVYLRWIGWLSPIWHATQLARRVGYGMHEAWWLTVVHVVFLVALTGVGWVLARRNFTRRLTK